MKQWTHNWRFWVLAGVALGVSAVILVPVLAGREEVSFTATPYADVIRFEAGEPTASLQIRIYDLSGRELWDSGVVAGHILDWDRANEWGERLAYGVYLYQALGWDADGVLVLQKSGKLALLPGDKVQLNSAPPVSPPSRDENTASFGEMPLTLTPMAVDVDHSGESWAFGQVGIGTTSPEFLLHLLGDGTYYGAANFWNDGGVSSGRHLIACFFRRAPSLGNAGMALGYEADGTNITTSFLYAPGGIDFVFQAWDSGVRNILYLDNLGKVGIGTTTPTATLEVHGSATNLLALYDPVTPTDPKFRVTKTGEVHADGAFYGAAYYTGSADVAERINTSEWVEKGDVVEIDPEHPGFFRKSRSPYSTKVAGIISTSPGVSLGNSFAPTHDKWGDGRPMLALAGRVLVKVTAENGAIRIGDLLVSSSIPGYAMRCSDPSKAVGAVIGKALEPLEEGTGIIMVQVMLR